MKVRFCTFTTTLLTSIVLFPRISVADSPKQFQIIVQRERSENGLIVGSITADGERLGTCYENAEKRIPAGTYKGVLRTKSMKNFVQGPGGCLDKTGDFLLEVADVPKRTDILFHAGNKPEHSEGCIMMGPARRDAGTGEWIAPEALRKLRLLFYDGKDKPSATPNKKITIEVRDSK